MQHDMRVILLSPSIARAYGIDLCSSQTIPEVARPQCVKRRLGRERAANKMDLGLSIRANPIEGRARRTR